MAGVGEFTQHKPAATPEGRRSRAIICEVEFSQRSPIATKAVSYQLLRPAIATYQFPQEMQHGPAIPGLCDYGSEGLSFVVHGAPQIGGLAADLYEYRVQMPTALLAGSQLPSSLAPDFSSEHGSETVPSETYGFMAIINAALTQPILHIT